MATRAGVGVGLRTFKQHCPRTYSSLEATSTSRVVVKPLTTKLFLNHECHTIESSLGNQRKRRVASSEGERRMAFQPIPNGATFGDVVAPTDVLPTIMLNPPSHNLWTNNQKNARFRQLSYVAKSKMEGSKNYEQIQPLSMYTAQKLKSNGVDRVPKSLSQSSTMDVTSAPLISANSSSTATSNISPQTPSASSNAGTRPISTIVTTTVSPSNSSTLPVDVSAVLSNASPEDSLKYKVATVLDPSPIVGSVEGVSPDTPIVDAPTTQFPSFYRRELPLDLVHFNSDQGRQMFKEAVVDGTMELYFPLAEQFLTQSEPAYCAISTLAMCFNAFGMDPGKQWKRPWRWYAEEMLECCTPLGTIMREGLTFRQFASLARCHGVLVEDYRADLASVDHFRSMLEQLSTASSVVKDGHASSSATHDPHRAGLKAALVVSFSRKALNQTGDGHMSPIGGYHRGTDSALIMDVARFKYPPYWVPVERLYDSMLRCDKVSQLPRGYCVLSPISSRGAASDIIDVPRIKVPTNVQRQVASAQKLEAGTSTCPRCNRPSGTCAQPTHHSHMTSPITPHVISPNSESNTSVSNAAVAPAPSPIISCPSLSASECTEVQSWAERKPDCWLDIDPLVSCPPNIRRWFGKLKI